MVRQLSEVGIAVGALGGLLIAVMLLMVPPGQAALSLAVGSVMLAAGCLLAGGPRLLRARRAVKK